MTEDMTEGGGTAGGKRSKLRGCISVCTGSTEGMARCNEEQEEMKKAPYMKRQLQGGLRKQLINIIAGK